MKIRTADTVDAEAVALLGSAARPTALLVRLADGTTVITSPALTSAQARMLGGSAASLLSDRAGTRHPLAVPIPVEVRLGHGRHGRAAFVRIRRDD